MRREILLVRTFVALADNLVDDFDVVDLLSTLAYACVEAFGVTSAGLMLASPDGDLRVMASSSDEMRLLELFETQSDEGPCCDCYRTGQPVVNVDLATIDGRWPVFGPRALAAGFRAVHALPMRHRARTIGALNLFRDDPGPMDADDLLVAQSFADVATVSLLQDRAGTAAQTLNNQLNQALQSRVVIEQAKGIVAEAAKVDMGEAFVRLRSHARTNNLKLSDVAHAVIDGTMPVNSLTTSAPSKKGQKKTASGR